jgi:hypothetical protein
VILGAGVFGLSKSSPRMAADTHCGEALGFVAPGH